MPERISVPALREALADNGIHPEVMTNKGLERMVQDIENATPTVEQFDEFTGGYAEHHSDEKPDRQAEQLPQSGIADPLVSDEQYVEAMRRAKLAVNGSHIDRQSFRLWLEAIALVAYVAGANSAISKIGGEA